MLNIFRRKDVVTRFVVGSILVLIALAMVITLTHAHDPLSKHGTVKE